MHFFNSKVVEFFPCIYIGITRIERKCGKQRLTKYGHISVNLTKNGHFVIRMVNKTVVCFF